MSSRWLGLVVDSQDPARLARWWAEVLGYHVTFEDHSLVAIGGDDKAHPGIAFVPVPEPKAGKNRLHLDLEPDDQTAEIERLVDMGARHVDVGQPNKRGWTVLADPEGNEFCVLRAAESAAADSAVPAAEADAASPAAEAGRAG